MRVSRKEGLAIVLLGACAAGTVLLAGCSRRSSSAEAKEVMVTPESSTTTPGTPVTASVPGGGPVSFRQADSSYREGNYSEAVSRFTAYTTAKPENPWGHFMLGVSSWKSGDRETAEREFRKAIELDSSMVKSRLDLSRVLLESDQPGKALDELQGALALDSTSASVYRLLGRAHEGLRETDAAIDAYHHALVLDDQDVWSMNNLALIYLEQGKIDEALKPLARVSQLDTTTAQFWNNLGVVLERSGRFTGAAQAFTTALAIDSGYTKASVSLARVSSRTDDPSLPPLDLAAVAQSFVDEIATWKKH